MNIYQISSGNGPDECELAVRLFAEYLTNKFDCKIIDGYFGRLNTNYRSIVILSENDLNRYIGSIKIIFKSPYRPNHKRMNWFITFNVVNDVEEEIFDENKVTFEYLRSSGPGGQNVNKVESGVRATYTPTNQTVVCTEERSQLQNKRKAIAWLRGLVISENREKHEKIKMINGISIITLYEEMK